MFGSLRCPAFCPLASHVVREVGTRTLYKIYVWRAQVIGFATWCANGHENVAVDISCWRLCSIYIRTLNVAVDVSCRRPFSISIDELDSRDALPLCGAI